MSIKPLLAWSIAVLVAATAIWFNYIYLTEAYGSGPPYYGRTTNMDKWTSPVPTLLVVDLIVALLLAGVFRFGVRKTGK
jgi:hypothetical protein